MKRIETIVFVPLLAALLLTGCASTQLGDFAGSTSREKTYLAVYDLRGNNLKSAVIEEAVQNAIRLHVRKVDIQHGIPPSPLPAYPAKMTVGKRKSGGPQPECSGEVFSIEGIDTSMSKYGETTYHRACLFPYAGGYRVNYFAIFATQSGVGSKNPFALVGTMGRAVVGATGFGDSSNFIGQILQKMEEEFKKHQLEAKLVQLYPEIEGRVVVPDDLLPPENTPVPASGSTSESNSSSQRTTTSQQGEQIIPPVASGISISAEQLPPELIRMREAIQKQKMAYQQQLLEQPSVTSNQKSRQSAQARKELAAMGLQYYNQDQFVAAIRRNDKLAVELFLQGEGVSLEADASGEMPLGIAEKSGFAEIVALLKKYGEK